MADKFIKSITFVEGGDQYYPLPKVTNADDGKVLKVVDGVWGVDEYPKNLVKIEVTTAPTTVNYTEGDTLDLTGLVVTATFSDGTTEDVTSQCIFSPASGTILASTDTSVNIIYAYKDVTKVVSQIISVAAAANVFTFTITFGGGSTPNNTYEYQAEEGMTWGEFVSSKYNSNGDFVIDESRIRFTKNYGRAPIPPTAGVVSVTDIITDSDKYIYMGSTLDKCYVYVEGEIF